MKDHEHYNLNEMFGFIFNFGQKYIDTPNFAVKQYKTKLNNIFDNPWTNPETLSMFNIMFCSFLTQIINLKPQIRSFESTNY